MINTQVVFFFLFVFSCLILTKFFFKIMSALLQVNPKPLLMSNWELIIVGLTTSYIITYLKFA